MSKLIVIFLSAFLISCCVEPIDNYRGAVVCDKDNPPAGMRFVIKYNDGDKYTTETVYVTSLDYNTYGIGDTIR